MAHAARRCGQKPTDSFLVCKLRVFFKEEKTVKHAGHITTFSCDVTPDADINALKKWGRTVEGRFDSMRMKLKLSADKRFIICGGNQGEFLTLTEVATEVYSMPLATKQGLHRALKQAQGSEGHAINGTYDLYLAPKSGRGPGKKGSTVATSKVGDGSNEQSASAHVSHVHVVAVSTGDPPSSRRTEHTTF